MEKISLKNKYFWFLFLACLLFSAFFVFYFTNKDTATKTKTNIKSDQEIEKIGWITDLHADKKETVEINDDEIIYSTAYREYLPAFFEKMQAENIETVIVTGDMTNDGESECAINLKKIADEYDLKVLWVRGNHDRENTKTMEYFGVEAPYYYFFDTKKTRIIILNLTDEENKVDEKQLLWLKEKLAETNLDAIVAMHFPMINYDEGIIISEFKELESILRESGRVKLVISGGLHKEKNFFLNGIQYETAYPMTMKNQEGSYYIIKSDNKTYTVESLKL